MTKNKLPYQPRGINGDQLKLFAKMLTDMYVQNVSNRLKVLREPKENDIKRWVWELLQNAKDTIATTEQEQIEVVIEVQENVVIFKHNGSPFNLDSLYSLIYKKSSDDKRTNAESTGQYGTGFLTTHTLSKNVELQSIFKDSEGEVCGVGVSLHRDGEDENELREGLQKTVDSVHYWKNPEDSWTTFTYHLKKPINKKSAQEGVKSLTNNVYYALSFIKEVASVTLIKNGHETTFHKVGKQCLTDDLQLINFETTTKGETTHTSVLYAEVVQPSPELSIKHKQDRMLRYSIALLIDKQKQLVLPVSASAPRLYCMLPLIGSEKFHFPVMVNSPDFEPDSEREFVLLSGDTYNEEKRRITDTGINQMIITGAVELYAKMLKYLSTNNYKNIHYLALGAKSLPPLKEYLDKKWYADTIQKRLRALILGTPMVETSIGLKKLTDVYFPQGSKIEMDQIWEFTHEIAPESLPKRELIEDWAGLIWIPEQEKTTKKLAEQVAAYGSLHELNKDVHWVDNFLKFVQEFAPECLTEFALIPNIEGHFKSLNEEDLSISDELPKIAYELLEPFEVYWAEIIVHPAITVAENLPKKGLKELSNEVNELIKVRDNNILKNAALNLIKYIPKGSELISEEFIEKRKKIWQYARDIFGEVQPTMVEVEGLNESIWERCDHLVLDQLVKQVALKKSLDDLKHHNEKLDVEWLNGFIGFVSHYEGSDFLNRDSHRVLPNQYGLFVIRKELSKDDNIPKELKEDVFVCLGLDLRLGLLHKGISSIAPEKVISVSDVANSINVFLGDDATNEELKINAIFRLVSLLPTEGARKQEKIWEFGRKMYGDKIPHQTTKIPNGLPELWNQANQILIKNIIKDIEDFVPANGKSSIERLGTYLQSVATDEVRNEWVNHSVIWLSDLIDFVNQDGYHIGQIIPNQNGDFCNLASLNEDKKIPDRLKDILAKLSNDKDFRNTLINDGISLQPAQSKNTTDIANTIDNIIKDVYVNKDEEAMSSSEYKDAVKLLVVDWFNEKSLPSHLYEELRHNKTDSVNRALFKWSFNNRYELETQVLSTLTERRDLYKLNSTIREKGLSLDNVSIISKEEEEEFERLKKMEKSGTGSQELKEVLDEYKFDSIDDFKDTLKKMQHFRENVNTPEFDPALYGHKSNPNYRRYVDEKLSRARNKIEEYLRGKQEYNFDDYQELVSPTVIGVEKNGQEILIVMRPSDGNKVIIFYDEERDLLDSRKVAELWVEDGRSEPKLLTLGKILKMTGIIKFPVNDIGE